MIKVDHIVYFTKKSPNEVVAEQLQMGWHAVIGGKHEKWGTQNALMYMRNAYIEWLSIEKKDLAEQSNHPLMKQLQYDLANGENWGTICFSVRDLMSFQQQLEENNFKTLPIQGASRITTSGVEIHWKMLFIEQSISSDLPFPFFIEWEIEEQERINQLRKNGSYGQDNDELFVSKCLFNVYKPEEMAKLWSTILHAEIQNKSEFVVDDVRLHFREKLSTFGDERLIDVTIEYA